VLKVALLSLYITSSQPAIPYLLSPCHTLPPLNLPYLTSSHPAIPYLLSPCHTLPPLTLPYLTSSHPTIPSLFSICPTSATLTLILPLLSLPCLLSSPILSSQVNNDSRCVLLVRLPPRPHAPLKAPEVVVPPSYLPLHPRASCNSYR
jgi:hypothetical protein